MKESKRPDQRFSGEIAWITIALMGGIVAGEGLLWWSVLTDRMPLWVGGILATVLAYLAFTVAHEAAHGNIHGEHSRLWLVDEILGWTSAAILTAPYPAFRVLHLRHHSHTNDPAKDPDHFVASPNPLAVLARCAVILPYYYGFFFLGDASRTRSGRQARIPVLVGLAGLIAIMAGLTAAGLGRYVLGLWVIPSVVATGLLALVLDWMPHHPHSTQGRYRDTRVILGPGLFLLTMGHNYHLIHHLYPRIPFYAYGRCFDELRDELEGRGAVIEGLSTDLPRPFSVAFP